MMCETKTTAKPALDLITTIALLVVGVVLISIESGKTEGII